MSEKELNTEYLKKYVGRKNRLLIIAALSFLPLVYLYNVGFAPDFCVSFLIIGYIFITGLAIVLGANGLSDISIVEKETGEKHVTKKVLIVFLALVSIINFLYFGTAMADGDENKEKICKSIKGSESTRCLKEYKIFLFNDDQINEIVKEKNKNFKLLSNELKPTTLFEDYNFSNRPKISLPVDTKIKKLESEPKSQTINININLNINIPGIDVVEQKIPVKLDVDSTKNIDVNLSRGIREMIDAGEISKETPKIDSDVHVDYPPTVDYRKEFEKRIEERREKLLGELEKRKNKILNDRLYEFEQERRRLNDLKEELKENRFLFPQPSDNRFGER